MKDHRIPFNVFSPDIQFDFLKISLKIVVEADRIYTMNPASPNARLMIAQDGFIQFAGNAPFPSESEDATYYDFKGCIITPGLIDSHNHFLHTGLGSLFTVDLSTFEETTLDAIIGRIQEFARKTDFPWILGGGLNERRIKEGRLPTALDLDRIDTNKSIFITHNTVHYGICNTAALRIAQVSKETPDPIGAKIGRFSDDEPNGILYEPAAMDLVRKHIPTFSKEQYKRALRETSKRYLAEGLTCVKDTGGTGADLDEVQRVEVLNELSEGHEIEIRQSICLPVFSLEDARKKIDLSKRVTESDFLKFVGYKLFLDGSGYGRTAWMKKEWNRNFEVIDRGNFGFPLWKIEDFRSVLDYLADNLTDEMIDIHTIGDMAIETALIEIKRIRTRNPKLKFSLIHVYSPEDRQLELMKDLDVYVEFQSPFLYFYGDLMADNLGEDRLARFMRARSFLDKGVTAANSSDSPVVPFAPIYGIFASMYRETKREFPRNEIFNRKERIQFEEAVALYTSNAVECVGREDLGILEKGRRADFVVWNKEIQNLKGKEKLEGNVVATFMDGRQVYANSS